MTDKLTRAREVLDEGRGRTRGIVPVRRDVEVVDFRELARRMAELLLAHAPESCDGTAWNCEAWCGDDRNAIDAARRAGLL